MTKNTYSTLCDTKLTISLYLLHLLNCGWQLSSYPLSLSEGCILKAVLVFLETLRITHRSILSAVLTQSIATCYFYGTRELEVDILGISPCHPELLPHRRNNASLCFLYSTITIKYNSPTQLLRLTKILPFVIGRLFHSLTITP